jgi:hypothetical protein
MYEWNLIKVSLIVFSLVFTFVLGNEVTETVLDDLKAEEARIPSAVDGLETLVDLRSGLTPALEEVLVVDLIELAPEGVFFSSSSNPLFTARSKRARLSPL